MTRIDPHPVAIWDKQSKHARAVTLYKDKTSSLVLR
jgi:hypothetical protein